MKNQLNRLSILLIADSEEDVRRIMGELAGADREIDGGCAENPEKLDAALREKGWDIALFDASMSGLDVQEALQKVRNADRKLPFIVATKPVGEAQTADWMRAGVSDVVVRGDSERLVEAVKREAQSAGTDHGDNALPDRFERTVKEAPFPIMVHAEDGEVVTINKAWTDMTGYEPDEIAQDLGFARGKALTDDALRESKGRMDALVNSLPGMAYRCYNEPGWSMEFCSDAAAEITGYEATELMLGCEVLYGDLIHPDDRERVWNCVQEAVQEDRKFELEYRIIGRDGNERWVWEQGCAVSPAGEEPVFLEGIITDITERKQVTAEKERLLQAVEMAQEAVIMTDAEGRIKYANAAAAEMQGYKRNDMIGLHVSEFNVSEEPHGVTSEIMGTVRQEGSWEGEIRNERPDGTEIVTYASVSAVRDSDGRIVNYISTKNDITERKRAEHKMRIQSRAIESSINGITMIDAQGKVILANPATLKMWGYEDRDQVIGHMASEFWENPENARAAHRQTRQNAEWSGELVAERKDGSTFPVQVSMSLVRDEDTDSVYVIGVFLDLTERKKAEEQVQELASFQETVINGANVWIEVLDMRGDVILWNDAAEDITGYSREEVQGKGKIWEWLYPDPDYRAEIVERAQEVAQDEMDVVGLETTIQTKEGEERIMRWNSHNLKDGSGDVIGSVAIGIEVTEEKKAERELKKANEELAETLERLQETEKNVIRQERLRALGEMASGIAHDFNNALSQILGFTELLTENPQNLEDREKAKRYLGLIRKAASDAGETVRRMRSFYRQRDETEGFEAVDLNSVVEECISLTAPRWRDQAESEGVSIEVETDLEQNLPQIAGQEAELREGIANLIFNGVDAMSDGGKISFDTVSTAENVELEVRDTGEGMEEKTLRRCLEPFFSTKGDTGSGLGLSLLHGIVERHGGNMDIESEPGIGTCVRLSFPRMSEDASNIETETEDEEMVRVDQPVNILVVDDEDGVREVVAEYLRSDGHSVKTASDGAEGLTKFHADWFDLVIVDRAMPEMAGDELAKLIKKKAPEKPVIMLTGFGDIMHERGETVVGVDAILSKPIALKDLRLALNEVLTGGKKDQ